MGPRQTTSQLSGSLSLNTHLSDFKELGGVQHPTVFRALHGVPATLLDSQDSCGTKDQGPQRQCDTREGCVDEDEAAAAAFPNWQVLWAFLLELPLSFSLAVQ